MIPPATLVADLPETHVDELHMRIVYAALVFDSCMFIPLSVLPLWIRIVIKS